MKFILEKYLEILIVEKNLSKNSIISYKNDLLEFLRFLEKKKIKNYQKISKTLIGKYLDYLGKVYSSRTSYNRKISSLRGFVKYLIEIGELKENFIDILKTVKPPKNLPKYLTKKEINKLLKYCHNSKEKIGFKTLLLVELLCATGLRVSELVSLSFSCLRFKNLDNREIEEFLYITGKGRVERLVPISCVAKSLLEKYIIEKQQLFFTKKQKYIFYSNTKTGYLTRQRFGQILKELALKVNLDPSRISPHILRHSFATHLLNNGLDLRWVQELLGHKNISTTEIYTHLTNNKLKEAVEKYHPMGKKS